MVGARTILRYFQHYQILELLFLSPDDVNIECDIKIECEDVDDTYPQDIEGLGNWTEPIQNIADNRHQQPAAVPNYRCKICRRLYFHSESLSRHLYHEHVENLNCRNCDTNFATVKGLKNHMGLYREYATRGESAPPLAVPVRKIIAEEVGEHVEKVEEVEEVEELDLSAMDDQNESREMQQASSTYLILV